MIAYKPSFKKIQNTENQNDSFIFETTHCKVGVPNTPHVSRKDGGHLVVFTKRVVAERFELTEEEAWDLMRVCMCLGRSMTEALTENGIKIETINYQDNGNWYFLRGCEKPELHVHLYGRARDSIYQEFGQSLYFPNPNDNPDFYNRNEPLSRCELDKIMELFEKYYLG